MKKFLNLFGVMLIVTLAFGFTSCSSSDGGPDTEEVREMLQGSWQLDRMEVEAMGQSMTMTLAEYKDFCQSMGLPTNYYDEVLVFNGDRVNGGRYRLDGSKFEYLDIPDYEGWIFNLKVSETTLIMSMSQKQEGIKIDLKMIYKRR